MGRDSEVAPRRRLTPDPPSGTRARVRANLDALQVLAVLDGEDRRATDSEREVLSRWSGWGATPEIFDERTDAYAAERVELKAALDDTAFRAARRTILNAHYTDARFVDPIWDALDALGLPADAVVLEPGCGAGGFIAHAPDGVSMVGVELDPTTGRIAQALHPDADIRVQPFETLRVPQDTFDAAIGNVPFGDYQLHDPVHNPTGESIHNHFILKSLALTRPGGVVAAITSRYVLDSRSQTAREQMAEIADLVGAVRLPRGAHRRAAGTDVITDILVLRKRLPGEPARDASWISTVPLRDPTAAPDDAVRVNTWFDQHPDMVVGTMSQYLGRFGPEVTVTHPDLDQVAVDLADHMTTLADRATDAGLRVTPRAGDPPTLDVPLANVPAEVWAGHITYDDGQFWEQTAYGGRSELAVPGTQAAETRALIGLRDHGRRVLELEAASESDTPALDAARTELRTAYGRYVARWGPINRFSETERTAADGSTKTTRRAAPAVTGFARVDPQGPFVRALEVFDENTQTAVPAAIQTQRVLQPRAPVMEAETPQEALAVCVEQLGRVDVRRVAGLLGVEAGDVPEALGDLVYLDPTSDELVPAAEYLSGNVRTKIEAVEPLVDERPELDRNLHALRGVLPDDIAVADIQPRLGAAWIDAATHQQFLRETFEDRTLRVEHAGGSEWAVSGRGDRYGVWGTREVSADRIAESAMRQRPIYVTQTVDTAEGPRQMPNAPAMAQANDKVEQLQEAFEDWIWKDPARASALQQEYNRRFNSLVLRDYSASGEKLTLPGLAASINLRPHQRAAVARMLSEPTVGLFHGVGAGKTLEMVAGAMELKRLGMISKPAVVVPNHMLEQFSREWLQAYPSARILAASSEDLRRDKRREFLSRIATHDWDAVIMTQSAFERLPVSRENQQAWMERQLTEMRASYEKADLTAKTLENKIVRMERRLEALRDAPRDENNVTFEESGIDYLIVDEAHSYKNLMTMSNIPSAQITGSQRASDLALKLDLLRDRHGDRIATFATATPIANSLAEAHVMTRYLRPDLLVDAGVDDFDAWAATFGRSVTAMEVDAIGRMRQQTRFARFDNLPELLAMWHTFGDVKLKADLGLPEPELAPRSDGQQAAEINVVPPGRRLRQFVADLGERAEAVRMGAVDPTDDNMLKISSEGRMAALDIRLVLPDVDPEITKIQIAADRIHDIHVRHRDNTYLNEVGETSPQAGAFQMVFCDMGTPTGSAQFNVYDALKRELVDRGMQPDSIRYIHDATTDTAKGRLFEACRNGGVSVLVGSTQKMGVGTNVQHRAIALHHLECPWRPADVEQREGRILRQGNQHEQVHIHRYVTEQTFDAFMWQTVERKSRFIDQIMSGHRRDIRSAEDIATETLSFAEVKALATGDPLVLEQAQATAEVERLARLERGHTRQLATVRHSITTDTETANALVRQLATIEQHQAALRPTTGDQFTATIHPTAAHFTDRKDAAAALAGTINRTLIETASRRQDLGRIATIGGIDIDATVVRQLDDTQPYVEVCLHGLPHGSLIEVNNHQVDGASIIRSAEARLNGLDRLHTSTTNRLTELRERIQRAQEGAQQPFRHADALKDARQKLAHIDQKLSAPDTPPDPTPADEATRAQDLVAGNSFAPPGARPQQPGSSQSPPRPSPQHRVTPEQPEL